MIKRIKERIVGITGSASGATSVLGSWQICHNVCLGIVAFLGVIGITVTGMPLMFLTKVAVPFWITAFVLLLVTIGLYVKKKCISKNLIMFNSGLIVAGIPFQPLQDFRILFWSLGGVLAIAAIGLFVKGKIRKKQNERKT
jgi:hypothetical protein